LHHRVSELGLSRTRVVLMFYGCSLFFLLLAFAVFVTHGRWAPFAFGIGCLVLLMSARSFSFSREWFAIGRILGNSIATRKQTRYALTLGRWLELEAERSASPEELWSNFAFLIRKLGFSAVSLSTPRGTKSWHVPGWMMTGRREDRHLAQCQISDVSTLQFSACASVMELRAFELLSDLAAEMWLRASQRWERQHLSPCHVTAAARDFVPSGSELLNVPLTERA
jgi:UDP-GlcNAc:undecaprenyl-phosphate/decaprenyl-phosphate GlcNAc-1-phosphate transferase